jgi:citrate lyase subunit beta/citryl-CoA lyase
MTFDLPGPAILFCPADRPDRYEKALQAADMVILDLEDAVAADRRSMARKAVLDNPLEPDRVIVRINAASTAEHALDVEMLLRSEYSLVMLAKAEAPDDVAALRPMRVIGLCETPIGVMQAGRIAAAQNTVGLMWGAEDFVAGLGGRTSRAESGHYADVARYAQSHVLVAAKAYGRLAIDAVYLDYADGSGLAAESRAAVDCGFDAKACIHPTQADVVRRAYRPTAEQVAYAERVLAAAGGGGVASVDGQMVDGPLVAQSRRTIALSQLGGG